MQWLIFFSLYARIQSSRIQADPMLCIKIWKLCIGICTKAVHNTKAVPVHMCTNATCMLCVCVCVCVCVCQKIFPCRDVCVPIKRICVCVCVLARRPAVTCNIHARLQPSKLRNLQQHLNESLQAIQISFHLLVDGIDGYAHVCTLINHALNVAKVDSAAILINK